MANPDDGRGREESHGLPLIDQTYARSLAPCPECGNTLEEKRNRKTGDTFLGCSRWPRCVFTRPIPADEWMRRQGATRLEGF